MLNFRKNFSYILILFMIFFSSVFILRLLLQAAFAIYLSFTSTDAFSLNVEGIWDSLKLSLLAGYLGAGGVFTGYRMGRLYLLLFSSISFFLIWIAY